MPTRAFAAALALACATAVIATLTAGAQGGAGAAVPPRSPSALERRVFERVNAYRVTKDLAALAWNDEVAAAARRHSAGMAAGRVPFGHAGFQARIEALDKRAPWTGVAENVYMMSDRGDPAASAAAGWIDSPGHRKNIEGPFDQTGVGVARSASGRLYFTQVFIEARRPPRAVAVK
jgi:uncharacterized protein YkwD